MTDMITALNSLKELYGLEYKSDCCEEKAQLAALSGEKKWECQKCHKPCELKS